jgi:hypothetical protein
MSRNAWRWFNEAQSLIICFKLIMDANRNGLDDPRLNEIQENEAECIKNGEMEQAKFFTIEEANFYLKDSYLEILDTIREKPIQ